MTAAHVVIAGTGIVSALGRNAAETAAALRDGRSGLRPIRLFPTLEEARFPVGEVPERYDSDLLPRTHRLALVAAEEAISAADTPVDAVVLGTTTGGILTTESLLKAAVSDPSAYRYHSAGTVTREVARRVGCTGPALTVSTACSSGAAAIALAMAMIRSGRARRVLAGGADALCRLTYYGFHSLQLIDPNGAKPFDRQRKGMSVAEGAAMLLLTADDAASPYTTLLGAGLSCDAHHPSAPHPEGRGAAAAMSAALADSGLTPAAIDYINLHGTATPDNDSAESAAVAAVFADRHPPMSSVKGAFGHTLAAAGAIEAVVADICLSEHRLPTTVGLSEPDPRLAIRPIAAPCHGEVRTILSNAFGFGGNNAVLVFGAPGRSPAPGSTPTPALTVLAETCITGSGPMDATLAGVANGTSRGGALPDKEVVRDLPPRQIRRLRRLSRLALAMTADLRKQAKGRTPGAVYLGTGWGALTETDRFLERLFESEERFPSPTDFVGSVHNAAAGQIALTTGATGPNLTLTGDTPFEQALMAAELTVRNAPYPVLVLGVDEAHERLTPLLEPRTPAGEPMSDGGGGLLVTAGAAPGGVAVRAVALIGDGRRSDAVAELLRCALPTDRMAARIGLVMAGIPAAARPLAHAQLAEFSSRAGLAAPVVDYRRLLGDFASAGAAAAALASRWVRNGRFPDSLAPGRRSDLGGKGCLLLALGETIAAVELMPS